MGQESRSALLTKYSELFEANPRSRVFAPLAESYRQLGLLEEAMKILKRGLAIHPTYPLGHLVLASCYYDKDKKELCYQTLLPFVSSNRDNLSLQKLFAQVCLDLGHSEESLAAYKYLLFLAPKNTQFAEKVEQLESQLVSENWDDQDTHSYTDNQSSADDWVELKPKQESINRSKKLVIDAEVEEEQWALERPGDLHITEVKTETEIVSATPIAAPKKNESPPLFTHTLVDIYLAQGHRDKAIEVLEKLLELNPSDQKGLDRLEVLQQEISVAPIVPQESILDVFDRRIGQKEGEPPAEDLSEDSAEDSKQLQFSQIQQVFSDFLDEIRKKSSSQLA